MGELDIDNPAFDRRATTVHHDSERGLEKVDFDDGVVVLSNYNLRKAFYMDTNGQCHRYSLSEDDDRRHKLFDTVSRDGMTLRNDDVGVSRWMTLIDGDLPDSLTVKDNRRDLDFVQMHFTDVRADVNIGTFAFPLGCIDVAKTISREDIVYKAHDFLVQV